MSGEQDRDYVQEVEGQMQAAQALIESLEEEVASLRRDLEQASFALKAAQEGVAAREEALEEKEKARSAAEIKAQEASGVIAELRTKSSDEQLGLTNQHISELARLQDRFQGQLRAAFEAALSVEDPEELREEHRKVRQAAQQRYDERIAALENSCLEAQERLRADERDFDRKRAAEIEEIRTEAEEQKRELERELQERLERQVQEALSTTVREHAEELETLRKSFAAREEELQAEHQALTEGQQAEFEARQREWEKVVQESEEQHQAKLREIKGLAENREQELKKTHSARLAETKSQADRRVDSLRSQREADNKALQARHEEDLKQLRTRYEERMNEAAERYRLELWTAQEKLEGLKLERTSEAAAYRTRLRELEAVLQSEEIVAGGPETSAQETPAAEAPPREPVPAEDTQRIEEQLEELKAALSVSEGARAALARELEETRERVLEEPSEPNRNGHEQQRVSEFQTDRGTAGSPDGEPAADERVRELEARLRESQDESRRNVEELQRARENLRRLSDPEHRMRGGISAFNASEHARHVASISKSLGLPKIHAEMDEEAKKPVFTFVWEELAWRRYVAEPVEDLQEPRVYLLGGGDDPEEVGELARRHPNARVDAQGRLILGVQAR